MLHGTEPTPSIFLIASIAHKIIINLQFLLFNRFSVINKLLSIFPSCTHVLCRCMYLEQGIIHTWLSIGNVLTSFWKYLSDLPERSYQTYIEVQVGSIPTLSSIIKSKIFHDWEDIKGHLVPPSI